MKNGDCLLVSDLYDLYKDDVCSNDTRDFVRNHIENCETCRVKYSQADTVTVVYNMDKKSVRKLRKKLSAKYTFFVVMFLCIAAIPYTFIAGVFPELIIPSCFTSDAEIQISSVSEFTQADYDSALRCVTAGIKKDSLFNGSVLEKAIIKKPYKHTLTQEYAAYYPDNIMLFECTVRYYTGASNTAFGKGQSVTVNYYVLRDGGEWSSAVIVWE